MPEDVDGDADVVRDGVHHGGDILELALDLVAVGITARATTAPVHRAHRCVRLEQVEHRRPAGVVGRRAVHEDERLIALPALPVRDARAIPRRDRLPDHPAAAHTGDHVSSATRTRAFHHASSSRGPCASRVVADRRAQVPTELGGHAEAGEVERARVERSRRLRVVNREDLVGHRVDPPRRRVGRHQGAGRSEPDDVHLRGTEAGELAPVDRHDAIAAESEVVELRVAVEQRRRRRSQQLALEEPEVVVQGEDGAHNIVWPLLGQQLPAGDDQRADPARVRSVVGALERRQEE